ncbi:MAG: UDP-4-amino-4,6-dideoxy-N-acetyl-beta-L-altrosamine transaminase [Desulfobacterales bacterium]
MKVIPYGRQDVTREDIEAVIAVLRSDYLTQGPVVPQFEKAVSEYCGVDHAIAVNSATSGLHIACLALGLGPGDMLWTTPVTFVASANCALYCGAGVDFVDIDPATFNMCVAALEEKLVYAEREGKLPKIVVPVHLCGQSCDMAEIHRLAEKYGFRVIEDASHAIGGRYSGRPVGSCEFSDATVFSFHPVKIITTGEGGMVLTNNADLAARMALLRSHGITRDPEGMSKVPDGPWYYEQVVLGFNYRMTDIQAALGLSQLSRVDAYVTQRNTLAARYGELLEGVDVVSQRGHEQVYSSFHLYVVRVPEAAAGTEHKRVFEALRRNEIGVNLHYIPVHLQPYYARRGHSRGDFPNAEQYYKEAITLPLYPTLSSEQQEQVAAALRSALRQ